MKKIYKIGIGLALGAGAYGTSTFPITIETIPARLITTSGEGCFELLADDSVIDIRQEEYNNFKGIKAWCGTKFDTAERQPKKGDYWDTAEGRNVWAKNKPSLLSKETDVEIVGNEMKITKPFYETLIDNAEAAISHQTNGGQETANATSISFAVDVGSGSNRLLDINTETYDGEGTTDGQISSATYNSVGLSQAKEQAGIAGTNNWTENWYLLNPTASSNTLVVNLAGNTTFIRVSYEVLNGVKQTGQPDAVGGGTCDGTVTCAASVTTVNDNSWVITGIQGESCSTAISLSSGGTSFDGTANICVDNAYDGAITPAGAETHTYTQTPSTDRWVWVGASFQPDIPAGGGEVISPRAIFQGKTVVKGKMIIK